MEKMLTDLFETASFEELAGFDSELGSIAEHSECEDSETVLAKSMRKAGISRRRLSFRKRLTIMLAAALILIPASVAVAHHINKLEVFFGIEDGNSPYVSEFVKRQAAVENDDAMLVVDGALSDDVCSYIMVSFYAKNEKGRQYIYDIRHKLAGDDERSAERWNDALAPYGNAIYESPLYYDDVYNLVFTQQYKGAMVSHVDRVFDESDGAVYYKITIRNDRTDITRPITLIEAFSGLSVDINFVKNAEMIRLVSDDPECFHDVKLSPFALYITFDERDVRYAFSLHSYDYAAKLKNGETVKVDYRYGGNAAAAGNYDVSKHEDWVEMGRYSYCDLVFRNPIDLEEFESIEIDGIVYRPAS